MLLPPPLCPAAADDEALSLVLDADTCGSILACLEVLYICVGSFNILWR